ncbi:hypothetical protein DL764_002767 [Monosporascus ibericus]|uniref:Uncharacterized protein n=1 Tax=Monosporascus ibericus TaxID=155417 RepID=A0A4Q4TLM8_9PEZI|nr:hypothetical protein DL764_002767 [Monosporascus ibericus]
MTYSPTTGSLNSDSSTSDFSWDCRSDRNVGKGGLGVQMAPCRVESRASSLGAADPEAHERREEALPAPPLLRGCAVQCFENHASGVVYRHRLESAAAPT